MPSYIGYKPQFDPISLQEYLAVPTAVLGEYAKAEDAYNETANKAEALKALLGERNADNEAGWKIVDKYERQLGDLADNISKGIQGPEAYRQAKGASRYYRENMLPLESGIPAYQEELKKWNTDPTMIGNKPILESYIKNPLYRAQMMSGNAIQQEAVKAAAAVSNRRKQETKDRLIRGGQNYSYYELTGFSPDEQQAYYLNSDLVPELKQLEDSITDKYVQQGYNDADARRYAKLGIIEGITYDRKRHDAENKNYETPAQRAARIGTDTLKNKIDNYLNGSSQWGRVGIELNVGTTGRTDLKEKKGNLARLENGKVVGIKLGKDFDNAFGTVTILPAINSQAGTATTYNLTPERLFNDDGRLRTPAELKAYLKNEFERTIPITAVDGTKLTRKITARDFNVDTYEKVYEQLLGVGFDPSTQFGISYGRGRDKNGYAVSTSSFDKKRAYNEFKQYIAPMYQSDNVNTQFGFYTYPINVDDMDRFIQDMPSTQLYEFKGMTVEKDADGNYVRKPKLGKHDSKENLQKANANKNVGLHMSYDPVSKGFIWYTNDTDPKYWYMRAEDLDRSLPTQDYTNVDFQRNAAADKMLNERIQQLILQYQANPNDVTIQQELYVLLTTLEEKGDINQNAYNLLMAGLDRTFFKKSGTYKENSSEAARDKQNAIIQSLLR